EARQDECAILRPHVVGERQMEGPIDEGGVLEGGQAEEEALLFLGVVRGARALAREIALVERGIAAARRQADADRHAIRVERRPAVEVAPGRPGRLLAHLVEAREPAERGDDRGALHALVGALAGHWLPAERVEARTERALDEMGERRS